VNKTLPVIYLVSHGETAWSFAGQHMESRDLPLIERGERNALRLKERLRGHSFARVLVGPLPRVIKTCELAGFGPVSKVDEDLADWNYGLYEGSHAVEILKERPSWNLFRDGCPGGESPGEVTSRAGRVLDRLRSVEGDVLVFSSAQFIRVLAARWICLEELSLVGRLLLSASSLSALGYENDHTHPVIRFWNDLHHAGG
jgi:probable phosphoglycerate mutase